LWEAFLDPSDSYFLFADLVGFWANKRTRGSLEPAIAHPIFNLTSNFIKKNKMKCELMLTYDTPALRISTARSTHPAILK
jgi:hypothetical protein